MNTTFQIQIQTTEKEPHQMTTRELLLDTLRMVVEMIAKTEQSSRIIKDRIERLDAEIEGR